MSRLLFASLLIAFPLACGPKTKVETEAEKEKVPQPPILKPTPKSEVEVLREKLGIPDDDMRERFVIEGGKIVKVDLDDVPVKSLAPLKGLPLEVLWLNYTNVADLSLVAAMPLRELNLQGTPVADISAVQTIKTLKTLWLNKTKVTEISPVKDLTLESLDLTGTTVTDLSPIAGMTSLKRLNLEDSAVKDLTPLQGLSLQRIIFDPAKIEKGLDIVKAMKSSLQEMHTYFPEEPRPRFLQPDEFWDKYRTKSLPRRP